MTRLQATCVAINERGVLIFGRPGSGKSDLALRLIDRGAHLVSDDGIDITRQGDRLIASAPSTIAGKIEVRGIGIVERPHRSDVALGLAVTLDDMPERMPPDILPTREIEGIALPCLAVAALEPSAPIKVELGLQRWGLRP